MNDLEWLARNIPVSEAYRCAYITGESRTLKYGLHGYSIAQVDAERERLINRPSFEDYPNAKCFVQNADGDWYGNRKTADVKVKESSKDWYSSISGWDYIQQGEVIGDWRESLMVRPESEQVMKDWNCESLPPVGTVCLVTTDFHALEVTIKLYDGDSVVYRQTNHGSLYSEKIKDCVFSTIRTEEDIAVDKIAKLIELNDHSRRDAARAIYKAGYKLSNQ